MNAENDKYWCTLEARDLKIPHICQNADIYCKYRYLFEIIITLFDINMEVSAFKNPKSTFKTETSIFQIQISLFMLKYIFYIF